MLKQSKRPVINLINFKGSGRELLGFLGFSQYLSFVTYYGYEAIWGFAGLSMFLVFLLILGCSKHQK